MTADLIRKDNRKRKLELLCNVQVSSHMLDWLVGECTEDQTVAIKVRIVGKMVINGRACKIRHHVHP